MSSPSLNLTLRRVRSFCPHRCEYRLAYAGRLARLPAEPSQVSRVEPPPIRYAGRLALPAFRSKNPIREDRDNVYLASTSASLRSRSRTRGRASRMGPRSHSRRFP